MLFNKKEKELAILLETHFGKVDEVLKHLDNTMDFYLAGKSEFKDEAGEVHRLENEADEVREEILAQLHAGAFMPPNREDYVILAGLVDEIANRGQHISNLIVLTRPEIPGFLKDTLRELTQAALASFAELRKVLQALNHDINRVREEAAKVAAQESEVDRLEWDAIKSASKNIEDLAHKMQLRELIQMISSLADLAEDAADRFKLMLIKQTF
ncbi:MAG: DUF47 family protein [Candidatus Auribacterota bacterium]|nr:DUF47 family protein [Candidatus Auribacterota bacterium]